MNILKFLNKEENELIIYKSYKEGSTIHKEGDECSALSIVVDGSIKISSFTHIGNEIVYSVIKKDGVYGINLLFSTQPFYKGDVIALEKTLIASINKKDLLHILKNNSLFLENYLRIQSDFTKQLNFQIKLLSIEKANDRILFFLESNNNYYSIETISLFAKQLGLQRETTSRAISHLIKKGMIEKNKNQLKIVKHN